VKRPLFSIPVRDLDSGDQRRQWDVPAEWVSWALADSEAESNGTPGQLSAYFKKSGRQVLVKGEVVAQATMPCARSLAPVALTLEAPILLLLSPRAGAARSERPGSKRSTAGKSSAKAPAPGASGEPAQPGRSRRRERDQMDGELLSSELAAQDEYDGETVVLDDFVREHLLLELPLFPVRSDLPFESAPATDTRPGAPSGAEERPLDPRLAPLAALASQMRTDKE
jgi:uncharacterized protein